MILQQEGEIMKVGIEVVTGFLGAGKSAFINSLIKTTKAVGEKIIVLTCEIGNVKIKEFKEKDLFVKHINFMEDNAELDKNIYEIAKININTNVHLYKYGNIYKSFSGGSHE